MRSFRKSAKQTAIDITDFYAIKVRPMWAGLRQESAVFWWLCIYLFFEYIRPQSIYPAIDFIPWTQIALLGALLTANSDKSIKWVRSSNNALFVLFYLLVFLSAIFAFKSFASWNKISIVINWIIIYFMIINILNSEKRFLIFVLLFLLANFKMSQHGFRTFAMRGFSFANWGVQGSPGWFQNAGDFGLELTIFVPLAIAFIFALRQYWGKFKRLLFYLLPVTGLVSIVGTSSRGAQLGLAGVALWFALKSRLGLRAVIGMLLVGWALYSILPEKMLEKFETSGEDATSQARLTYWAFGMEVMKEHPLLGVGYENWLWNCWVRYPYGIKHGVECLAPHNTYIQTGAELGLPALFLYIVMILHSYRINSRTRKLVGDKQNKFILYMSHGLDGGMVGYVISSTFVTVLYYPVFWLQLAMIVSLNAIARKQAGIPA